MRITLLFLALGLAVAAAAPNVGRIVGGSNAAITTYRFAASLLYSRTGSGTFSYSCGGAIISDRVVLTAAYCLYNEPVNRLRVRIGSAKASSGGVVYNAARTVVHPNYNSLTADSDVAIFHSATKFKFNNNANSIPIAHANYNLPDNSAVTAIGWGRLSYSGKFSDTLRRVDIWTVNRNTCRTRYSTQGYAVTDNMLCAGYLDVGGRGQCVGDVGSPLIHGAAKTIVGVYSWSYQCGLPRFPGVNTFVPRFSNWIVANSYSWSAVAAAAPNVGRIVGGSNAAITTYRFAASLLYSRTGSGTFSYSCGGAIISDKVVLTAAYCLYNEPVNRLRVRIGSAKASSGGVVYNAARTVVHPNYNSLTADSDVAIFHSAKKFKFNNNANSIPIAHANYNLPDNSAVTAIGWGRLSYSGKFSDTLRRVDIWTVNRSTCRTRYSTQGYAVTDNMLCAGYLDVGGRGQCVGDVGSPLIHGAVKTIVGVYSWSYQCGLPRFPGVNTFVPRFSNWIVANS